MSIFLRNMTVASCGALVGYMTATYIYNKKLNKELDEASERLAKEYSNEIVRQKIEQDMERDIQDPSPDKPSKEETNTKAVDYTAYGRMKEDHPMDDNELYTDMDIANDNIEHKEARGREPKIISSEDFGSSDISCVSTQTLIYYQGDNTLTDEDMNIIDDPEQLLGNCLNKYDFRSSDESCIYVRNYRLQTDYEVTKVSYSYSDVG